MPEPPFADRIAEARAETEHRLAGLRARHADIVDAAALDTADDEHDPEGATIAFEREQLAGAVRAAVSELAELDSAAERLWAGSYGHCERCGTAIADGRLTARPAARECIDCANAQSRRRR